MHGVARKSGPVSAAEEAERAKKIAKYNEAKRLALEARQRGAYDDAAYAVTAALLALNPDFYSLWNFRRELLLHRFSQNSASISALCAEEAKLTEKALLKNPKAYGAWHHRIWTIDQGTIDLKAELALCNKMLAMDHRNFHVGKPTAPRAHDPRSCLAAALLFSRCSARLGSARLCCRMRM
jgi:geranylgeranyl transferase type-2 subunit alpha